ncbi:hypothetical protein BB559_002056 [Furculomyces boomerangus]|uniref:Perilipin n=1 Tax=Furculomyces boomerangus TaxID=61424 RepID=A0A2T9YYE0_9FUNG|nr:hypothetical protein BB559_002056 [Furculomyces boomerangus]
MVTKTQTLNAESQANFCPNDQKNNKTFFGLLYDIPVVNTTVNNIKSKIPESRYTLMLTSIAGKLSTLAENNIPYQPQIRKSLSAIDSQACMKLKDIKSKYPIITKPTEELIEAVRASVKETKSFQTVNHIVEKAQHLPKDTVITVTWAVNETKEKISSTTSSATELVIKTNETSIMLKDQIVTTAHQKLAAVKTESSKLAGNAIKRSSSLVTNSKEKISSVAIDSYGKLSSIASNLKEILANNKICQEVYQASTKYVPEDYIQTTYNHFFISAFTTIFQFSVKTFHVVEAAIPDKYKTTLSESYQKSANSLSEHLNLLFNTEAMNNIHEKQGKNVVYSILVYSKYYFDEIRAVVNNFSSNQYHETPINETASTEEKK